ncbi:hypothetical protein IPM19_04265 [bacterium]|nr:MAG: hypothetical protein IPM19_04265 [bacterium]
MSSRSDLRWVWIRLYRELGARGNSIEVYNQIADRYSEPHRYYHTLTHIEHCLRELQAYRLEIPNRHAVELALWLHDVVYDTKLLNLNELTSEDLSAEYAMALMCTAGLPQTLQDDVRRLILITKHNALPQQDDEKILVDIDLAILGQPKEIFDEYEANVRKEYGWVSEEDFTKGRIKVLESFLSRNRIYSTEFFHDKYSEQAEINMDRSLTALERKIF